MVKGIDQFRAHFEDVNDRYVQAVIADPPQTLKPFGLGNTTFDEIIEMLRNIYELNT